jgi:hypothetical protein
MSPFAVLVKVPMVAILVYSVARAAPLATSMVVVRPGTISPHLEGWNEVEDSRRRLFCLAMQSALVRGGKKLATDVTGR